MPRLPIELLDDIFSLAIALRILSVKDAVLVCHRGKLKYQKLMFKSVKLDPFDDDIPNLGDPDHVHLIPHIEELRIVSRSNSSIQPTTDCDLSGPFTSFLRHAANASSMVFRDSRIQWKHVSSGTLDAFCTVFRRKSFSSLTVSVDTPFPSWMLLYGACVASQLTVYSVGPIMSPPETVGLVSYQCSITRLMLRGNAAVKPVAEFCLQQRNWARDLLRNVVHLGLEYDQTYTSLGRLFNQYAEILLGFLASQLEVLDLRVEIFDILPSHISDTALRRLRALKHLTIHISGCTMGYGDTLKSAKDYMESAFLSLPPPSLLKSLSLKVSDWRFIDPDCQSQYEDLLGCIYRQLSCHENWPHLTSTDVLVDVRDGDFTEPFQIPATIHENGEKLEIISLLQVNNFKGEYFNSSVAPRID